MIYKPGREGLSFFRSLMGRGARGWRLEELCFSAEAIEFSLVREARRLRLEAVLPRPTGRRCLFSGPGLGLRLRNDREDVPPDDVRAAQGVFQALSGATFVGLFRRLLRDALYYADSRGTQPQSRLERYYRLADHSPDWWKFFYRKSSFLDQEVVLGTRGVKVNHGTWECRFNSADHDFSSLRFFADEGNAGSGTALPEVHTGLGEKEVVGGKTLEVLAAALRRAARENRPDCIHLNSTCLPELLGEDPRPLVAAVSKEFRLPVFWTSKTRDSGESLQEVLRQMLGKIRFSARRDPRAVILAGIASPEAQAEAGRLVGLLGLRAVGCLYPKLDLRSMPRVGTASALIWVNPVGWERLGDGHFLENDLAVVRFHPPFGVRGTQAWLERVRGVLGLRRGPAAVLSAAQKSVLSALRRDCRGRKAALIGDRADIEMLLSRERGLGFSVGGLLCEMGLSVQCLVYSPEPAQEVLRPSESAGAGSIEFIPYRTPGELDRRLRAGVELAFSHFNHDPRLVSCGVAGFCEADLGLGVEGFLASAARLLRLCRTRPFPGHREALAPWR